MASILRSMATLFGACKRPYSQLQMPLKAWWAMCVRLLFDIGIRYWYKKKGVFKEEVDPRVMYEADHYRLMHAIKLEYRMGLKQIEPITMHEARNGIHFADLESMRGNAGRCCQCSILFWHLPNSKRPRTLTAILLENNQLTASTVY